MKYFLGLQLLLVCTAYSQHYDFIGKDFSRIDSIAINYKFEGNLDPIKITKDLTEGLETDLDKYRVIFRWIAENIEYDVKLYRMTISHDYDTRLLPGKAKRWKRRFDKLYKRHTILNRMTICEGYAWLLETMCREAGLSCVSVTGHVRTTDSKIGVKAKPNHAWNAVKIDNKWYLSDPTWASGGVNEMLTRYIKDFNEVYFLASPDEFIANHFPSDTQWTLLYKKPSLIEFFNSPIKTTAFLENKIPNYSPLAGNIYLKKDSAFQFQFSINKELESFSVEKSTYRNKEFIIETIRTHPIQNKEGYYVSSISFHEKGNYSIWIYINRKHTFIYKVFVK
jgi:transglutaminase/protease-like cytokinesis protein 3